jgi:hypothetical protein
VYDSHKSLTNNLTSDNSIQKFIILRSWFLFSFKYPVVSMYILLSEGPSWGGGAVSESSGHPGWQIPTGGEINILNIEEI